MTEYYPLVRNHFITGAGGTGKSHTVQQIYNIWSTHLKPQEFAICATTGCAAVLLNCKAKTFHSWSGIGHGNKTATELLMHIQTKKYLYWRWKRVKYLLIDEVSMMSPIMFTKLNYVAKAIRNNPHPFGGIKLVLVGDFCQLPPVERTNDKDAPLFLFQTDAWKECNMKIHNLTKIYRQTDQTFQTILNQARIGRISESSISTLQTCVGKAFDHSFQPTFLFPHNADVNRINTKRFNEHSKDKPIHTYEVETQFSEQGYKIKDKIPDYVTGEMDRMYPYESTLRLCEGAQVMLLVNHNVEQGLVNGSQGIVTGFSAGGFPFVRFLNDITLHIEPHQWEHEKYNGLFRCQIPLRLAYATSIHKCQGATLDCVSLDIGKKIFEYGQAYVGLSRVKSLEGLCLSAFDPSRIKCHKEVRAFYKALSS